MRRTILIALLLALTAGCGLTVTNEKPPYQELSATEKQAVEIILAELTALDAQLRARTRYGVDPLLDRENIDVSFDQIIFVANLGDGQMHVSTWENLSPEQQALVQGWFKAPTLAAAEQTFKKLFYQFLSVSQGIKQFMYNAHTTAWVFQNRSLFNSERDSIRTALAHYVAVGRKAEMWSFLTSTCTPMIQQHDAKYGPNFTKVYLQEHFAELADARDPTGYMYFICRWIMWGKDEAEDLGGELAWLLSLRKE